MGATLIAAVSAVIAALAAVLTAAQAQLLRRQIRHSEQLANASLSNSVARQFVEVDRFFVEYAELRPYFYDGLTLPSDPLTLSRVAATAEMLFDLAESCHANKPVLGDLAGDYDRYFALLYSKSEALQDYSAAYGHLYPDSVRRLFSKVASGAGEELLRDPVREPTSGPQGS